MPAEKKRTRAAAVPERSLDERLEALKRANDIRTARAELKKAIAGEHVSVLDVLADPPEYVLTAKVYDLLLAVPRFGRVRANKILNQARITPRRTVGSLSERQRHELLSLLDRRKQVTAAQWTVEPVTETEAEEGGVRRAAIGEAEFLLEELRRLLDEGELDREALERAARIAAAEQSWRDNLGTLLSADDVAQILGTDPEDVRRRRQASELIGLSTSDGDEQYPAFQFQDGKTNPALAQAHGLLVEEGHVSPWTAASWVQTSHPELEQLSPAQWTGTNRDAAVLIEVAEHDAHRLAQ
jgi:ribosomal protein S13